MELYTSRLPKQSIQLLKDKVAQEEEENLLQAAMLTISDLGFRLDETQMVLRVLAEENDKLTAELAEARASRTQLESKVRELEATLSEWENGGEEAWQGGEQSWDNLDDPTAEEELTQDSNPTQMDTESEAACDGAAGAEDAAYADDGEHRDTSNHPLGVSSRTCWAEPLAKHMSCRWHTNACTCPPFRRQETLTAGCLP